jgi:hypothetical protein
MLSHRDEVDYAFCGIMDPAFSSDRQHARKPVFAHIHVAAHCPPYMRSMFRQNISIALLQSIAPCLKIARLAALIGDVTGEINAVLKRADQSDGDGGRWGLGPIRRQCMVAVHQGSLPHPWTTVSPMRICCCNPGGSAAPNTGRPLSAGESLLLGEQVGKFSVDETGKGVQARGG